jgi:DNA-binding transcriptional regulator YiaG
VSRTWPQIRAEWEADPEFRAAYAAEYPYVVAADMLSERRFSMGLTERQYARRFRIPLRQLRCWESGKHPVPDKAFGR